MRLYREGLALILEQEGFEVVATAGDCKTALAALREPGADVIVLDPAIGADTAATVRELLRCDPRITITAFLSAEDEREIVALAEAGVGGYFGIDSTRAELVATVDRAAVGELICSPKVAGALLRRVAARQVVGAAAAEPLTARELDVADLIDRGLSNKQIALRLSIELATVKNHVHHILEKLAVARRGEAVAELRLRGILPRSRVA